MRETKNSQENNKRRRKSKIRRQSMTCKDNCPKAKDDKREEQENMEVESIVDQNEKLNGYQTSAYTTLMANNRALAAALEDTQLELRSAQLENVQLKEQIHENHHKFVEKSSALEKQLKSLEQLSGNHVPKTTLVMFQDIYNLLSQSSAQYVQGTNFLSDAVNLVRSLLIQANGPITNTKTHVSPYVMLNNVSPYVDPVVNAACTTPPPDEPSAMEITASQTVLIETYDTVSMKSIDRDLPFHTELEDVNADTTVMDVSNLEVANRRSKRKSCMGVSYAEPGLRSKLRRGDRFTDTTLYKDDLLKNTRKKRKSWTSSKRSASLPGMGNASKKRAPLVNLTNIITEEC